MKPGITVAQRCPAAPDHHKNLVPSVSSLRSVKGKDAGSLADVFIPPTQNRVLPVLLPVMTKQQHVLLYRLNLPHGVFFAFH